MSMNQEPAALMTITSDGIKINTPPGSAVITNATEAIMRGVEQTTSGGIISHTATNQLTQIGGSHTASNGGKIINSVEGGSLAQIGVKQSADSKGEIINRIKKLERPLKITALIAGVGLLADVVTLLSYGKHVWGLISG
jgi:hypothetical protein